MEMGWDWMGWDGWIDARSVEVGRGSGVEEAATLFIFWMLVGRRGL